MHSQQSHYRPQNTTLESAFVDLRKNANQSLKPLLQACGLDISHSIALWRIIDNEDKHLVAYGLNVFRKSTAAEFKYKGKKLIHIAKLKNSSRGCLVNMLEPSAHVIDVSTGLPLAKVLYTVVYNDVPELPPSIDEQIRRALAGEEY